MAEIVFLGSGGGRFQMVGQYFKTGGFRIHTGVNVHVDPGPGALLLTHQYGLNPLELDGIVVTHSHPDHYTDAEVLIEAMTKHSTKKRGALVCSESVINGVGDYGPAVSKYHQRKPEKLAILNPGEKFRLNNLEMEAVKAKHSDPTTFGLILRTDEGTIGYTSDTQYFEGIAKYYEGVRILIANVTRPLSMRIPWHLCSDDLIKMLTEIKPELVVMIHMGMMFLKHEPKMEAARITSETNVETIPGQVGLRVNMGKEIKINRPIRQPVLEEFARLKLEIFSGAE
ncbi:MAG: MBL fold metallo-hydrolase [Candidatus Hadarchaeum sp.]|uniref:MBL fold metallo-hydrolase n=1 Tax=Candidatus Hadarchaeum sp. TaxID=2883567 RepID=UPI003D13C713